MRIFPLGWELTAVLVISVVLAAGLLFDAESVVGAALVATAFLTPLVLFSVVLRVVLPRR